MSPSGSAANRIAFIRVYGSAPIGRSVAAMLKDAFPDYHVDEFDITRLLKSRPHLLAVNILVTLRLYGPEIVRGIKRWRSAFMATPYLHRKVKLLVQQALGETAHAYAFSFQLQSLFDTSIPGLPHFIYTDHTHLANLAYDGFDRRALHSPGWIAGEKETYTAAIYIFTRSTNISRSLIEDYGVDAAKIRCVYVGVNTQPPAADPPAERYGNQHILFVGIDWERKGGPELVQAFEQLTKKYPDARLTIVGAEPQINSSRIHVVGRVPVHEVDRYYQTASIFCLPTKLEPFGVVFIEAMANRLPIIATTIGALPDFVADGVNGFLVEPGAVDELVKALDQLLASAERCRQFGEAGFQLVTQRYNWQQVGQAVRETIEEKILANG